MADIEPVDPSPVVGSEPDLLTVLDEANCPHGRDFADCDVCDGEAEPVVEGPTGVDFFAQRYLALLAERDALASELAGVRVELERTEGDWAVAIREATRARAALCRHGKTGPHEHGVSGLGLSKIQCPGPATAESTDGC